MTPPSDYDALSVDQMLIGLEISGRGPHLELIQAILGRAPEVVPGLLEPLQVARPLELRQQFLLVGRAGQRLQRFQTERLLGRLRRLGLQRTDAPAGDEFRVRC